MLKLRIAVKGGGYAAWEDTYAYPEDIERFAEALSAFSGAADDEAVLRVSGPEFPNSLQLRAYVLSALDRSAFQFISISTCKPLTTSKFDFSLPVEVASPNRLGVELSSWVKSSDLSFAFEARGHQAAIGKINRTFTSQPMNRTSHA